MAYLLVGKDFIPPDIRGKVTGQAKYAEDFRVEGMVFARLLTSPAPHARINSIDASEALAMDGVFGILTADDPGTEELLTNEPKFVGDPILAVAAADETTAQNALERIRLDMEPLPFTVDPLDSLYPGGPDGRANGMNVGGGRTGLDEQRVKWSAQDFAVPEGQMPTSDSVPLAWSYGDVDAGFESAELVLDESFVTQGNSHHSMEPRTAMAYWQNGKCFVHTGAQSHTALLSHLARQIGIPVDDVVFVNEHCGGGFGSKGGRPPETGAIAAHLARKINRPVMLRVSRAEEYYIGSARGSLQGRIRIGFRGDGRVAAVDLFIVQDGGGNGGFGDAADGARAVSIVYQPMAMRFRGVPVMTNTTPRGPQRGPGQNQMAAIIEPILDRAARELGVDRVGIRTLNGPDNDALIGPERLPVTSAFLPEAVRMGAEQFDWAGKAARSGARNGSKVYGVGIGQAYHDAGRTGYDGLLVLTPDGRVHLHSGVGNLGTYSYVSTTRVAAEVLKCNWDDCVVHHGITSRGLPISSSQTGSNTMWTMTRTNWVAAMDALEKLKSIAATDLGGEPADYDVGEHRVFRADDPEVGMTYAQAAQRAIELGGRYSGEEVPEEIHDVTKTAVAGLAGTGLVGVAKDTLRMEGDVPALACAFAAVDVDVETGKVDVVDYVGVADCGTVIHPAGLAQQMKGAAVWGIGFALSERQIYDSQNALPGNIGLHQNKPPTYLDVPPTLAWDAVNQADPQNPIGSRGIGEPPMGATAAAVLSAISDALGGHLFNRTPVVPDMIVNHAAGRPQSSQPLKIHTA